jgi:hypothetical protein
MITTDEYKPAPHLYRYVPDGAAVDTPFGEGFSMVFTRVGGA